MKTLARWIWLAFLLPLVVDFVLSRPMQSREARPPVELLDARLDDEPTPAHGAFCTAKGLTPVYLGRDVPGINYSEFQDWCKTYGGEMGWQA